eukprot:2182096-Amphidinium_carterae.1
MVRYLVQYGLSAATFVELPLSTRNRLHDLALLAPDILTPSGVHSARWDELHITTMACATDVDPAPSVRLSAARILEQRQT